MCAIAGIVGRNDSTAAVTAVKRMVASLARRGPDGEGITEWDGAVLGHRRLAIFDLTDAGRQPMLSADGAVGVVFNGAIYNFRDLRDELTKDGCKFVTQTDTEILLHGYVTWGVDGLVRRLRGMFAFGLWDSRARRLYLVRDRLGVKPLVYTVQNGAIAFASTVQGLAASGFAGELDGRSVHEFLISGFLSDERSIYRGIQKLPAASILEWADGALTVRRYWEPPIGAEPAPISFREAVAQTKALFLECVAVRLYADVEVAALLSSGIDSSLVCWAVQKLGGDVTAFTVSTPGDPWDETSEAAETARTLGLRHKVVEISSSSVDDLERLVSAYAEPFGSTSALGMLNVSRAITASSAAKVLLTGDGGDDVFLGYPRHRHMWIASCLANYVPSVGVGLGKTVVSRLPRAGPIRRAAALLEYTTGGLKAAVEYSREDRSHNASRLLGERYAAVRDDLGSDHPPLPTSGHSALADLLRHELKTRFVGEYLPKVDGGTMHYGLEARSPFLDHKLWEFASTLPPGVRLHQGRLKAVLRQIAREEIGEALARRPKRGFRIPVMRWLANGWYAFVEDLFGNSLLEKEGWIRRGAGLEILGAARNKKAAPDELWYLLVLESWLRRQRDGSPVTLHATHH